MRGLTPLERAYLMLPPGEDVSGDEWQTALGLLTRGLVTHLEDDENVYLRKNDLGRLALRVCPMGEQ